VNPKFPLGEIVITANAVRALAPGTSKQAIARHDWGEVGKEDSQANNEALKTGGRLLSAYRDARGVKFWVITEHDRSITTILLPEDY
jgi:hypothetical protein